MSDSIRYSPLYQLSSHLGKFLIRPNVLYFHYNQFILVSQVCDVASAADLPHSGDSGFDGDSGSVVKLILFQLIGEDGAGS